MCRSLVLATFTCLLLAPSSNAQFGNQGQGGGGIGGGGNNNQGQFPGGILINPEGVIGAPQASDAINPSLEQKRLRIAGGAESTDETGSPCEASQGFAERHRRSLQKSNRGWR